MQLHFAAVAATLALAAVPAAPAAAVVTTAYAAFNQQTGARLFRYQRLGEGAGTGNRLYTTASPGSTALAAVAVEFTYLAPGVPAALQGVQNALLTYDGTTTQTLTAEGDTRTQTGFSGTLSFQRVVPIDGKTNLLSISFTNASFSAVQGGRAPTLSISIPADGTTVVQSSDFMDFGPVSAADFSFNFTAASSGFDGAAGGYGAGFRANGRGGFATSPAPFFGVPEPETWALFVLGFGMVGLALRRRPLPA